MKTLSILGLSGLLAVSMLALQNVPTRPQDYNQLKAEAESHYAAFSYSLARDLYLKAAALDLTAAEKPWVAFRLADTQWRAHAATQTSDSTPFDQAREQLERLFRESGRAEDRDRVWVEAQESLGDFWWTRRHVRNWGQAWTHYQQALEWWAGAPDLDLARRRYLKIVWTVAEPPQAEPYYYYGYYGNTIPLEILENTLKIAGQASERAHAHYLIAMTLRHTGDWEQRQRVANEFEAAIQTSKSSDWYDDALYHYGEWMSQQGRFVALADGQWRQEPDFIKALDLFRRLTREFIKGETRYYDQAQEQIKTITLPSVSVSVPSAFLPDSEIQYHLSWRNCARIDFTLTRVDLTSDVRFSAKDSSGSAWLRAVALNPNARVKSWTKPTADKGDHKPGQETLRLDGKLNPGAYILEAHIPDFEVQASGSRLQTTARELVLVTDSSVVLKASHKQALVYFCDATSGAPLPQGKVTLWEGAYDGQKWAWRELTKSTDADGIAVFSLSSAQSNLQLFVGARSNARQAFSVGNSYRYNAESQPWRIYAFTDRPAYRPKEQVQWKFVARRLSGSVYSTPAEQTVEFEIADPRGAKVNQGKATLNAFGSAWGTLELSESMPLGEYAVTFWDEGRRNHIGRAVFFRIEEYKLPEFKVTVRTPEEKGRKKAFRLGDKVEVNIQAEYYFGGAVANASVEVLVHQNPFYHFWHAPQEYPWFYADMSPAQRYWGGSGTVVKRETLKTDATGKAILNFETPRNSQHDYEYRIEARVTDSSRREIVNTGTVRVTRQLYYVYPRPKHNLHRPQDKVTIDIKALDANGQPIQAEGRVKVTRDYWYEIWLDPNGREVQGAELKSLRDRNQAFPPAAERKPWQLKFRGYQQDDILTSSVKTGAEGEAEFSFTPEREGYYRILWTSEPGPEGLQRVPVRAESTVWVARNATTELGYRHGGLEIILDKDTFQAGRTVPVLLSVPSADRYVLFTTEADDLHSYQLVHVTGTAKLVELEIREKHVPNFFLSAAMVSDRQFFMDTKQVIVPPVRNFLTVEVQPDRSQYQPREEGTLVVTSRDHEGKPVPAELSLGLVDESVYYIQQDYAGDPRQFYYGTKRPHVTQTQSTLNLKGYARLVDNGRGGLVDDRELEKDKSGFERGGADGDSFRRRDEFGVSGGVVGGARAAVMGNRPASAAVSEEKLVSSRMMAQNAKEAVAFDKISVEAGPEPAVQIRSDFRSTVFWQPDVITGTDGKATVKVKYPDSLTTWKAVARVVSAGNQFGIGSQTTRTQKPLIVRLQAPRFFVAGDTTTISAVINNNTDQQMTVTPSLNAEALEVQGRLPFSTEEGKPKPGASARTLAPPAPVTFVPLGGKGDYRGTEHQFVGSRPPAARSAASPFSRGTKVASVAASSSPAFTPSLPAKEENSEVLVPPHGEARVDWMVASQKPGNAKLKVTVRSKNFSDAMEKEFFVYEHGIEKFISKAGKLRGDDVTIRLDLPRERRAASTTLGVQVTPSLAVTMLDALPYLIDYPYGCTEQTMSRFLPAAITLKTLKDLGVDPETVMTRMFGGIVVEHANRTHTKGKKDLSKLDDMVKQGLDRLYGFQHSDGGWGWWKEGDSDHFMSAYVVWGLVLAREAGIAIKSDALDRGVSYLDKEIVEEEQQPDQQAWMLHALSAHHATARLRAVGRFQAKAFDNLWNNRQRLNAYTRALLALSAHHFGNSERAQTLIKNLENGVKRDRTPDSSVLQRGEPSHNNPSVIGTAHWGEDGLYWRWSDGGVEATAFALRALLTIDPGNALVEPVTHWIVRNRRGAQWSNTRDTAITVLALNDYLRHSQELTRDASYELRVNGQLVASRFLKATDVLSAPSRFEIDRKFLRDGPNEIHIQRKGGQGALYFATEARFFSLEEPVTSAGNEIFVRRQYYRLYNRPTLLKGLVTEKWLLNEGEKLASGDRVEVVLTVEAKNHYEYLVFEDLKPAGLEAVQIRSGEPLFAKELKPSAVNGQLALIADARGPLGAMTVGHGAGGRTAVSHLRRSENSSETADSPLTGRSRWVYQELRDRKVALFIDKLPEGYWEIRYELRAEIPGSFHALPVVGHAMYVPEIRCNGTEQRLSVVDK